MPTQYSLRGEGGTGKIWMVCVNMQFMIAKSNSAMSLEDCNKRKKFFLHGDGMSLCWNQLRQRCPFKV